MAQLQCPCGYVHDPDTQPDAAWLTIPDAEYDAMESEILRFHREHRGEEVQTEFGRIYECPECRRLMWSRPGDATYAVFVPERRYTK
jgi:hypothetical protein